MIISSNLAQPGSTAQNDLQGTQGPFGPRDRLDRGTAWSQGPFGPTRNISI